MKLQKFGIEIRKIGSLGNLYEDVDRTLSAHKIGSKEVSSSVQANAIAHSLQKMISTENYFSITCIRNCAEICQLVISAERMRIYQSQHCVNWSEMTDDFRQILVVMVLDDFRHILNPNEETVVPIIEN